MKTDLQFAHIYLFQTRRVRFNLPTTDGDVILDVGKVPEVDDAVSDAGVEVDKSRRLAGESRFRTRRSQQQFSHNRRDTRERRETDTLTTRGDPGGRTVERIKSNRRRGCNFVEHM